MAAVPSLGSDFCFPPKVPEQGTTQPGPVPLPAAAEKGSREYGIC